MADLEEKLRPVAESLLEPGEELLGMCIGTQTGAFSGKQVVIAVTPERLIVQGATRKFEPKGDAVSMTPETIAKVSADGGGGGWLSVNAAIMDHASVSLKLKTTDGQKLNLMMMRGGDSLLGRMGGGDIQEQGVLAIGEWFQRHAEAGRG